MGVGGRSKGSGQMRCPLVPIAVCCSLCNNCWALPTLAGFALLGEGCPSLALGRLSTKGR